jgi:hypothetical protein
MGRTSEDKAPAGVIVFNYARSKVQLPAAAEIPTLNERAFVALSEGDGAPFFRIEAIDYPAVGKGGVYEKSFFQSFLNVMKDRPIPGSKRGHEFINRPNSDFYTVGGELRANEDGKTGTAFLKIYIPPKGDTTDNAGFIRDARAGIVHFSIVTAPEYVVKTEKDEAGNSIQVWHYISSKGYERNDAVEYGGGAMAQVVNSKTEKVNSKCETFAKSCISSGKIDTSSAWSFTAADGNALLGADGDDWANYAKYHLVEDTSAAEDTKARWKYPVGKNGKVYRSALNAIASRAAQEGLSDVSDTASSLRKLMDEKKKSTKGNRMDETKEEVLRVLANLKQNAEVTLVDVAKAMGLEAQVRNAMDTQNAELVGAITAKLGDKPLERLAAILAENAAGADAARENAIVALVGPAKNSDGTPNVRFEHVKSKTAGLSGAKLSNALEELKKDPVMLALNAQAADVNSPINRIMPKGSGIVQGAATVAPLSV